jgi:hypothetical protein
LTLNKLDDIGPSTQEYLHLHPRSYDYVGAGKKTGISEIRYIDMDISEIDTFDDIISDMSISDISIAIKWTYRSGYIEI